MSKLESVLNLSTDNLRERREQLENALKETVVELIFTELKPKLKEKLNEFGLINVASVEWEFYYESDDEGGTDPYLNYIRCKKDDGTEIDTEELTIEKKSEYSDRIYINTLNDELYEIFGNWNDDLHEYYITEIPLV
ncbi:hypothetical protein JDW21_19195 [Bacillus subtilis]|uniref:hypothetical protein n=1 Tax=Bacillus subtilis TaxID=1423 RepID=UPI002ECFD590